MKHVYFIRHGEADGNVGGFSQSPDTPLTDYGHEQAKVVGKRCASLPIDAIYASVYRRATQTAKVIGEVVGIEVQELEDFHEIKKPTELLGVKHTDDKYKAYVLEEKTNYINPQWRPDGGENFADLFIRAEQGVRFLENSSSKHIVVVSHGRFLRFLASYLLHGKQLSAEIELQTSDNLKMNNTGITHYEVDGDKWKLVSWNDHAHFADW